MKTITFLLIILLLAVFSCDIDEEIDTAFIEVSGKVSENGETVNGALVLLVSNVSITEGFSLSNGSITDNNGNYRIINVEAGEYYVVAIEDNNGNLQFDTESDRLGFYGVDINELDIEPDKISVSNKDIEDINITYLSSL